MRKPQGNLLRNVSLRIFIKLVIHNFSNTLDNKGKRLTGLKFILSVGSSFLNTSTIMESFRVSGNLFPLKALLIYFVSSLKQNSKFFNMSTGISPTVALSERRFSRHFLQYFQKQTERRILCLF